MTPFSSAAASSDGARGGATRAGSGSAGDAPAGGPAAVAPARRLPSPALALALLLLVGAIIRLAYYWQVRDDAFFRVPYLDALSYDEWARRLARGDWGAGEPYWMGPLYPHLLAAVYAVFGPGGPAPQLLQWGLTLLNVWLAWRLARRLTTPGAALLAATLYAFYGPPVLYAGLLLMETVVTTALLLAALAVWRAVEAPAPRRWALAGAAVAAAALGRGNVLLLLAALPLALLWRPRGGDVPAPRSRARGGGPPVARGDPLAARRVAWRPALALWLGAALVLAPVALRNLIVGRDLVLLTSNGGLNLYIGQQTSYGGIFGPVSPELDGSFDASGEATLEAELGRGLRPSEVSRIFTERALAAMASRPLATVANWGVKAYRFWNGYELPQIAAWEFWRERCAALRWLPVPFTLLAACGLPGLWLLRGRERRFLLAFVLGYAASLLPFFVNDRYRLPLAPFVAIAAAVFLATAAGRVAAARRAAPPARAAAWRRAAATWGVALLLGAALWPEWARLPAAEVAWQSWIHEAWGRAGLDDAPGAREAIAAADRARPDFPGTWYMAGIVAKRLGDLEAAYESFSRARARAPDDRLYAWAAGRALRQLGRAAEAVPLLRQAASLDTTWARAQFELGIALKESGDRAGALAAWQRAVALEPGAPPYRNNLASLLAETGQTAEAERTLRELTDRFPDYARGWINLALFQARAGRREEALASLARALDARPLGEEERAAIVQLRHELKRQAGV